MLKSVIIKMAEKKVKNIIVMIIKRIKKEQEKNKRKKNKRKK